MTTKQAKENTAKKAGAERGLRVGILGGIAYVGADLLNFLLSFLPFLNTLPDQYKLPEIVLLTALLSAIDKYYRENKKIK